MTESSQQMLWWLEEQRACPASMERVRKQLKRGRSPGQIWHALVRGRHWQNDAIWVIRTLRFWSRRTCGCGDADCFWGYTKKRLIREFPWRKVGPALRKAVLGAEP